MPNLPITPDFVIANVPGLNKIADFLALSNPFNVKVLSVLTINDSFTSPALNQLISPSKY